MYVAVKGGEKAIDAAHALQESRRRGDTDLPELSVAQIEQQLNLAVDRVMTEGGIADRELAALALKQASGDNVEAIFLLRAYRTTLAKLAVSEPLDTTGMRLERRISAVYKDIPGGQLLGPTYDYTHRLLDFTLLANGEAPTLTTADSEQQPSPHVFSLLARQGLAKFEEDSGAQPDDITRTPPVYPCSRSSRLQQLMRGDEGYLLALAYSTQRGYGRNHPFAGEIRSGYIDVSIVPEELGFAVNVGELLMTECEMVNGFIDPPGERPHFTRGYGLVFGMSERKAMAMALVDRALQAPEYGEHATGPAQDEEFVLAHADNVEAAGFVSHLKLPHYVDFQAELELLKRLQQLMRGDEGYLLALAYSTQRGYGRNHPFAAEIRSGYVALETVPEELGFAVNVGELLMTECEMVNGFVAPENESPHFTRGYGLVFGMSERKAMAMALVDRALQAAEYDETVTGPAQDEEFVLAHADNVEAAGFVSHLKLPHYVDFQAELELLKRLQQEATRDH